jgi:hypothetical protein
VVLWFTIVQAERFSDFAPTCAFPVKEPNLDNQGFIHGGSLTGVRAVSVYHNHKDKKLLIQDCGPYSVLMADPPPNSHPAQNFRRDVVYGGNSSGKQPREAASIVDNEEPHSGALPARLSSFLETRPDNAPPHQT